MASNLAMSLSKLNDLVTEGNDARDQLLQTSNLLTSELQEILTDTETSVEEKNNINFCKCYKFKFKSYSIK